MANELKLEEGIILPTTETRRPINPGAEKWLGQPIKVLDHGFIYLVDYMGNDVAFEQAARVSYGGGTRPVNETTGLVRFLRRHYHTTPFEMAEVKFHAKVPIVVLAQWLRHRTANVNQLSARYSVLDSEFYVPEIENIGVQSSDNRQGRGEAVDPTLAEAFRQVLIATAAESYESYEYHLNDDGEGKPLDPERPMIAREISRMNLPQNLYTQMYWKCDIHNVFNFLRLRKDTHAQWEIRQYADAMGTVIEDAFPIAYHAFEDYELLSQRLTKPEIDIFTALLELKNIQVTEEEVTMLAQNTGLTNKRERKEMISKFMELGLISK